VTTCLPCHSLPSAGGSARGLYTLERAIGNSGTATQSNPGSAFGSGAAQLMVTQLLANFPDERRSPPLVNPNFQHVKPNGSLPARGSQGSTAATTGDPRFNGIRSDVAGASNTHFGIESVERIMGLVPGTTPAQAATMDLDGDGVANEMTIGEVTAETAFFL